MFDVLAIKPESMNYFISFCAFHIFYIQYIICQLIYVWYISIQKHINYAQTMYISIFSFCASAETLQKSAVLARGR